jgi:hypothetical protein
MASIEQPQNPALERRCRVRRFVPIRRLKELTHELIPEVLRRLDETAS